MKITRGLLTCTVALISGFALAESPSSGIADGAKEPTKGQTPSATSQAKSDMNLILPALQALSEAGDQEAIDAMEKSRENGGELHLTEAQAIKFIDRAKEKGLLKGGQTSPSQIGPALKALVAAGDPEAIAATKKAKDNGGRLELTAEEAQQFIARAKEKGLIGDTPGTADAEDQLLSRAQEAIQALAAAGDQEAAAELKKANENGGRLAIDKAKVISLVKRAMDKDLIKDTPADTDLETQKKAGAAIQALAAAGDEEAAAELKKAEANGGRLEITKEKCVELVKRAQDKGLIE